MKYEVTLVAVISIVLFTIGTLLAHIATAASAPTPGLWQESVTVADGVTVRKIRDTTGGELNVCYVASRMLPAGGSMPAPALAISISCLPERKP